jgi:SHS2 domain-containing protein
MTTVTGRGATLQDAFAALAVALFDRVVDVNGIEEREVREVRAHGPTAAALLERWIDECLYVHEVEGFAARRVQFVVWNAADGMAGGEPMRLHALLCGEPIETRHVRSRQDVTITRPPGRPATLVGADGGYEVSVDIS